MSSCICLAKMGSGASGLALYWNRLVWVNTCAPYCLSLRHQELYPGEESLSARWEGAAGKWSEVCSVLAPWQDLFTEVRGRGILRSSAFAKGAKAELPVSKR